MAGHNLGLLSLILFSVPLSKGEMLNGGLFCSKSGLFPPLNQFTMLSVSQQFSAELLFVRVEAS